MSLGEKRARAVLSSNGVYGGYPDTPALEEAPDELPLRVVAEHERQRAAARDVADRVEWPVGR
jgi:hypothetical protein